MPRIEEGILVTVLFAIYINGIIVLVAMGVYEGIHKTLRFDYGRTRLLAAVLLWPFIMVGMAVYIVRERKREEKSFIP